jgi:Family of unknown function (DUF6527)
MARLSAKLRSVEWHGSKGISFWCPGCDGPHAVNVEGVDAWTWNGDVEKPTLNPSILCWTNHKDGVRLPEGQRVTLCHSFVRDGRIQFLGDCPHALKNQTVDLPDWPDVER